MHKLILLSLLLISTTTLWAQEERLFIGGYVSFENLDADFESLVFPGTQGSNFQALYGIGGGGRAQYMITDALSLRIGLGYMQRSYQGSFMADTSAFGSAFDPIPGGEHTVHLISVPIQLGYAIANGEKMKLCPAAGIIAGIEIGEAEPFLTQSGGASPDQGLALIFGFTEPSLAGLVSIGLEYHPFSTLFVSLEPYFQHVFFDDGEGTIFPNMKRYGATLGVNVKL